LVDLKLSQAGAQAVVDYLISRGIDKGVWEQEVMVSKLK
jgi:outer membrane protein OmpA-like peptidoglycan-associated protein